MIIDIVVTIATFWHHLFLVSVFLTKVIITVTKDMFCLCLEG